MKLVDGWSIQLPQLSTKILNPLTCNLFMKEVLPSHGPALPRTATLRTCPYGFHLFTFPVCFWRNKFYLFSLFCGSNV